mmetsp:Transcript_15419/g.51749  ORF Transcript_15419/g.51749 Transcript_15419/m.51749 type:complete len:293 (+) Transcript_15419:1941-2819(+)
MSVRVVGIDQRSVSKRLCRCPMLLKASIGPSQVEPGLEGGGLYFRRQPQELHCLTRIVCSKVNTRQVSQDGRMIPLNAERKFEVVDRLLVLHHVIVQESHRVVHCPLALSLPRLHNLLVRRYRFLCSPYLHEGGGCVVVVAHDVLLLILALASLLKQLCCQQELIRRLREVVPLSETLGMNRSQHGVPRSERKRCAESYISILGLVHVRVGSEGPVVTGAVVSKLSLLDAITAALEPCRCLLPFVGVNQFHPLHDHLYLCWNQTFFASCSLSPLLRCLAISRCDGGKQGGRE